MTRIELSPECNRWEKGDATKYPPVDAIFLDAIARAGFLPFTGPIGLCGGKTEKRTVVAIHRGRGTKWELVFRENETDIVIKTTTDLGKSTGEVLAWLGGNAPVVQEDR